MTVSSALSLVQSHSAPTDASPTNVIPAPLACAACKRVKAGTRARYSGRGLAAAAEDFGVGLDGARGVRDVALDLRGGHQHDRLAADAADEAAENDHASAGDVALDSAALAVDDFVASDVAFDLAV